MLAQAVEIKTPEVVACLLISLPSLAPRLPVPWLLGARLKVTGHLSHSQPQPPVCVCV